MAWLRDKRSIARSPLLPLPPPPEPVSFATYGIAYGSWVVHLRLPTEENYTWLSPDEAERLAQELTYSAEQVRAITRGEAL